MKINKKPLVVFAAALLILSGTIASGMSVYFTDPYTGSTAARDQVINFINSANTSLEVAIYTFTYDLSGSNLLQIAGALKAARDRGVALKIITDSDELSGSQFTILDILSDGVQNGIISPAGVRSGNAGQGVMHNKFIVADSARVLCGSANFTYSAFFSQENNIIILDSPAIANYYQLEFNEMWNGIYGNNGSNRTPGSFTTNDGVPVDIWFGADDDLTWRLTTAIDNAVSSVYFLINVFSTGSKANEIAYSLRQAANRGVDVRGVMDTATDQWSGLVNWPGISLNDYIAPRILHDKLMITDVGTANAKVFTGSNNWSNSADNINDENHVVIHSPYWANAYFDHFRKVYVERCSTANGTQPVRRFGDFNGDNTLTIADYDIAVDIANGLIQPTKYHLIVGDVMPNPGVNGHMFGDGVIDELDVNWLAQQLGIAVGDDSIVEIHDMPDGTAVSTKAYTVTAVFGTSFYIQEEDRTAGIRVQGFSTAIGNRVSVSGTMASYLSGTGERYIANPSVSTISTGHTLPAAMHVKHAALGGKTRPSGYSKGIAGADSIYNIGLRMSVAGKVTSWAPGAFYIDDGTGLLDGSGNIGVKIVSGGLTRPAVGSYVKVTGISSLEQPSGSNVRVLRPSVQSDIAILAVP